MKRLLSILGLFTLLSLTACGAKQTATTPEVSPTADISPTAAPTAKATVTPTATPTAVPTSEPTTTPTISPHVSWVLDSQEIVTDMGLGWNLGNTLEACGDWINGIDVSSYERAWGNPLTDEKVFDVLKEAGFSSVRIPVAWSNLIAEDFTINAGLLDRVQEIVDMVVSRDMYAIVNIHWDGGWFAKFSTEYDWAMNKYTTIWAQIAERFQDYPDYLIFESLNEEAIFDDIWNRYSKGSAISGLTAAEAKEKAYGLVNTINQTFVDLIRSSGGQNDKRHLLIAGYGTDIDLTCDPAFQMPTDPANHCIVSVHYYTPSTFAILEENASWGKCATTWGTDAEYAELRKNFEKLKTTFVDNGIPVIIGEYGATKKNKDLDSVRTYLLAVAETALEMNMCPMLWDPGSTNGHVSRILFRFNDKALLSGYQELLQKYRQPESNQAMGEKTLELTAKQFTPEEAYVNLIGRTASDKDILWLAQSASGIEFTFTGTAASITIVGDSTISSAADRARFAVFVNGERILDEKVHSLEKTYEIFSSEAAVPVTVKLLKLSEAANSTFGIKAIDVTSIGDISPTADKELKIEFVGDSITCGYGVDDEDRNHHFSTATEDATKAYAYKTAMLLDADYSLVCYSGHGIISGYTTDDTKLTTHLVPPLYEKVAKSYGSRGSFSISNVEWDFNAFVPDIIVINLGTNDASYTASKADRVEDYTVSYLAFLKTVREKNPNSHIICALGIMGDELYAAVEDTVARYTAETGDTNISAFHFKPQDGSTGFAADWHPTEATHELAAAALAEEIRTLLENAR